MINGWENEGGSVPSPGGIDDRVLHAEIQYWTQGERDMELWAFEEMVYLPAGIIAQWLVDPLSIEYLWRTITHNLETEAIAARATKVLPITWRTISPSEVPQ